jgi:hypothetical protein
VSDNWQTLNCCQLSLLAALLPDKTTGHRIRFQTPVRIDEIAWTGVECLVKGEILLQVNGQAISPNPGAHWLGPEMVLLRPEAARFQYFFPAASSGGGGRNQPVEIVG